VRPEDLSRVGNRKERILKPLPALDDDHHQVHRHQSQTGERAGMCDVLRPPSAYVKETGTIKGRGVYSSRSYRVGEVVELCPVVIVPTTTERVPTEIDRLLFDWASIANIPDTQALALGFGSLYNDANPANMNYEADMSFPALRFVAARDIAADEELTINYSAIGGGAVWSDNNWFVRKGIARYSETPNQVQRPP
jgi:hypothetical protein